MFLGKALPHIKSSIPCQKGHALFFVSPRQTVRLLSVPPALRAVPALQARAQASLSAALVRIGCAQPRSSNLGLHKGIGRGRWVDLHLHLTLLQGAQIPLVVFPRVKT